MALSATGQFLSAPILGWAGSTYAHRHLRAGASAFVPDGDLVDPTVVAGVAVSRIGDAGLPFAHHTGCWTGFS